MLGERNRNSFVGDWFRSLIDSLKQIKEGFNSQSGVYGGGGIDGVNDRLDDVKTKLDTLNVSVKIDDPDIAATKVNTDTIKADVATIKTNTTTTTADVATVKADVATIKSNTASIKTNTSNTKASVDTVNTNVTAIYTLLNDRMLKRVVISRTDYDALAVKDPDTLYYVIESQSNS